MLKIQNLNTGYGESQILWDVQMHVPTGRVVCLMGRNGVGKTTLLKTIMGLLKPWSGTILFNGQELGRYSPDKRARLGIGYVPQGREIFPDLTVEENLHTGPAGHGIPNGNLPSEVFDLFPVLRTLLTRKGGVLSGGQQQQLAIARALVTRPSLLLLDEPTEGIQPSIILQIEEILLRLKAMGTLSILLVEQYLDFAKRLADYVYILDNGRIVVEGTQSELREDSVRRHLAI